MHPETISPLKTDDLKHAYYRQLLPALVAIALAAAVRGAEVAVTIMPATASVLGAVLFAAAIAAAVGLPVWIRAAFAHRVRMARRTGETDFAGFQRRLIATSLIAPYLAAIALAVNLSSFYQGGTVLAALYGIYYHYPSERRIAFDRRLFRVGSAT
jgi:hypothetical protein